MKKITLFLFVFCTLVVMSASCSFGSVRSTGGKKLPEPQIFNPDDFSIDGKSPQPWRKLKKMRKRVPANPTAARLSERTASVCFAGGKEDLGDVFLERSVIPRENYSRYIFKITAKDKPVMIQRINFFKNAPGTISGDTDGSVIVTDTAFAGVEHPMAKVKATDFFSANWKPEDFKAQHQTITLPAVAAGDTLSLTFDYDRGADRLDIVSVQLFDDTQCVATDEHEGFSGVSKSKNTYTLAVPNAIAKPVVKIAYKAVDRTQSYGKITVTSKNNPGNVSIYLNRGYELPANESWVFAVVDGTYRKGQLRRDFQNYLNNERAHPYRVFPHYNSWFHLGLKTHNTEDPLQRLTAEKALKAMRDFNEELFVKRGVAIDSYLWDDGWDEWDSLWEYHKGFPEGFKPLAEQAKKQKSGIGAWLSPWGGYNKAKTQRVAHAKKIGLPTNAGGLSLAQPKYYEAFRDRCLQMIRDYDMNLFKFDGIGAGVFATGASDSISPDLQGLINHIAALRKAKPNVFINCTVGTWASPFWMFHADSIWRGGSDFGTAGSSGAKRERWITYRDDVIHSRFVKPCPLFPLNSIMSHGIIVSDIFGMKVDDSPESTTAFANEVWMAIACGADLQEYYINPEMMSQKWWDVLASAVRWLRKNESVLRDTHWFGGAPARGEIYGYASFSPAKQIIVIRNPSNDVKVWRGSVDEILESPAGFTAALKTARVVYSSTGDQTAFNDGEIRLAPYEVKLIELRGKK